MEAWLPSFIFASILGQRSTYATWSLSHHWSPIFRWGFSLIVCWWDRKEKETNQRVYLLESGLYLFSWFSLLFLLDFCPHMAVSPWSVHRWWLLMHKNLINKNIPSWTRFQEPYRQEFHLTNFLYWLNHPYSHSWLFQNQWSVHIHFPQTLYFQA